MRKLVLALLAAALIAPSVSAQVRVKGYTKKDGTYVAPHYRSRPNSTVYDNYSTKGNVNPYTGEVGTKDPYGQRTTGYGSYGTKPVEKPTCTYYCPD